MSKPITPLKAAIIASGRSQNSVARDLDMDRGHLSRICNGLHVNSETQARIAAALGRQQSELFPSADGHTGPDDLERAA